MDDIKNERFLIKETSYLVDLKDVDFITWSENERDLGKYLAKLHIGSKETRYMCQSAEDLKTLLQTWSEVKGEKLDLDVDELTW
jgi:hypothetical protein|tara:strand:+ start:1328 stop:1579 length:252 start_codon:yes stop_codon:yes gene_type:complete